MNHFRQNFVIGERGKKKKNKNKPYDNLVKEEIYCTHKTDAHLLNISLVNYNFRLNDNNFMFVMNDFRHFFAVFFFKQILIFV